MPVFHREALAKDLAGKLLKPAATEVARFV